MSEPIERRIVDTIDLADDLRKQRKENGDKSGAEEVHVELRREKIEAEVLRIARAERERTLRLDRICTELRSVLLSFDVQPRLNGAGEEDLPGAVRAEWGALWARLRDAEERAGLLSAKADRYEKHLDAIARELRESGSNILVAEGGGPEDLAASVAVTLSRSALRRDRAETAKEDALAVANDLRASTVRQAEEIRSLTAQNATLERELAAVPAELPTEDEQRLLRIVIEELDPTALEFDVRVPLEVKRRVAVAMRLAVESRALYRKATPATRLGIEPPPEEL